VDGRAWASASDAVVQAAMARHDGGCFKGMTTCSNLVIPGAAYPESRLQKINRARFAGSCLPPGMTAGVLFSHRLAKSQEHQFRIVIDSPLQFLETVRRNEGRGLGFLDHQ